MVLSEVAVDIVAVEDEARFRDLMQAHHYLGAVPGMRDAALDIARAAVPAVRPIRPALRRQPCLGRLVSRKHPEEPVQRQTLAI